MMVCPAPPVIDTVLHLLSASLRNATFRSLPVDHYQSSTRLHLSIILRER